MAWKNSTLSRPWAKRSLLQARDLVLDILYPPACPSCGRLGYAICPSCRSAIVPIVSGDCRICNRPLEYGDICASCFAGPHHLERVYAATTYSGPIRDVIARFKYGNNRPLAGELAAIMARRLAGEAITSSLIVPVPLHRRRAKERGYNQSELLARGLAKLLQLPVATRALERIVDTRSQVGLKENERLANVKNAFRADPALVAGQDLLIVDDISTTGATLAACARECKRAGAKTVRAAVVGRG